MKQEAITLYTIKNPVNGISEYTTKHLHAQQKSIEGFIVTGKQYDKQGKRKYNCNSLLNQF